MTEVKTKEEVQKTRDKERDKVKDKERENRDTRIEEASAIKSLLKHSGYEILLKYYNEIKDGAHSEVFDERFNDDTLARRRDIYNQITNWLKIPERIIKTGEQAILEKGQEDDRPDTTIKGSDTPYVGRRY